MRPTVPLGSDPAYRHGPSMGGALAGFLLIGLVPVVLWATSAPVLAGGAFALAAAAIGGVTVALGGRRRRRGHARLCVPGTRACVEL